MEGCSWLFWVEANPRFKHSAYFWKGIEDGWLLKLIPVETAALDTLLQHFMFAVQKKKEKEICAIALIRLQQSCC